MKKITNLLLILLLSGSLNAMDRQKITNVQWDTGDTTIQDEIKQDERTIRQEEKAIEQEERTIEQEERAIEQTISNVENTRKPATRANSTKKRSLNEIYKAKQLAAQFEDIPRLEDIRDEDIEVTQTEKVTQIIDTEVEAFLNPMGQRERIQTEQRQAEQANATRPGIFRRGLSRFTGFCKRNKKTIKNTAALTVMVLGYEATMLAAMTLSFRAATNGNGPIKTYLLPLAVLLSGIKLTNQCIYKFL